MSRARAILEAIRLAGEMRPRLLVVLSGVALVASIALLVWFIVFSGYSEPIQFVYDSF